MPRPLTLPRIAATEAQALGKLARGALELPLRSWPGLAPGGQAPLLSLRHLASAPSPLDVDDTVRTRIEWSGSRLALDIPHPVAQEWTLAIMGREPASGLPENWRAYALEKALSWLTSTLTACGKGSARIVETGLLASGLPEGSRHRFLLSLDFPQQQLSIQTVLHCDNLALLMLAGLLPADLEPAMGPLTRAAIPARLLLTLGWTDLSADRWQGIETGDVIFITRPFVDALSSIALCVQVPQGPSRCYMAKLQGHTVTVTSEAYAMSDTPDHPEGAQAFAPDDEQAQELAVELARDLEPAQPLHSIAVRLSFDVGHSQASLEELERLQPGAVLQLDQPASDYISIRANGAKVGTGTLVEVDGRLGVMVTALAGRPGRG